jgi:hypothetical protein
MRNETLKKLIDQVKKSGHTKIKFKGMQPLNIEAIGKYGSFPAFSIMHFGEQNGDLMRDPDVVFLEMSEGDFLPVSFQNDYVGYFAEYYDFNDKGALLIDKEQVQDLIEFTSTWMDNIESQGYIYELEQMQKYKVKS